MFKFVVSCAANCQSFHRVLLADVHTQSVNASFALLFQSCNCRFNFQFLRPTTRRAPRTDTRHWSTIRTVTYRCRARCPTVPPRPASIPSGRSRAGARGSSPSTRISTSSSVYSPSVYSNSNNTTTRSSATAFRRRFSSRSTSRIAIPSHRARLGRRDANSRSSRAR
jgi:hypothetical protein